MRNIERDRKWLDFAENYWKQHPEHKMTDLGLIAMIRNYMTEVERFRSRTSFPAGEVDAWYKTDEPFYLVRASPYKELVSEVERLRAQHEGWWRCRKHTPDGSRAWGCPDCVRELRAEVERLKRDKMSDDDWGKFHESLVDDITRP